MYYLLEVGKRRISSLKNIDNLFQKLKVAKDKPTKDKVIREIEVELEKIFGVRFVIDFHYFGEYADNFAVIPYIKSNKTVEIKEEEKYTELIECGVLRVLENRQDNHFLTIDPAIHMYPTPVQDGIQAYIQVGLDALLPQGGQKTER